MDNPEILEKVLAEIDGTKISAQKGGFTDIYNLLDALYKKIDS
jgi:hypothetical protein